MHVLVLNVYETKAALFVMIHDLTL